MGTRRELGGRFEPGGNRLIIRSGANLETEMDVGGFFDYPGEQTGATDGTLVFLPEFSEEAWAILLSFTQRRSFRAGELLLQKGEAGRALYVTGRGRLEVVIKQGRRAVRVATLGAGEIFGEMAFFDGQARSATVSALDDGEMHVLTFEAFEVMAAHHPDLARAVLFDLGRILSLRLRRATGMLAERL